MVTQGDDNRSGARVLLVEDEPRLAQLVQRGLTGQGWRCTIAARGDEALARLAPGHEWDLVVLDRMLPGMGGIDLCRALRERGDAVPVLMLTARASVDDRVEGLDAGADDYLVKPFALRELYARVRALLRSRAADGSGAPAEPVDATDADEPPVVIGELSIDRVASEATWRAATVRLRRQEAELLALLAHAGERPVRRERLLDELWPDDDSVRDNQLDVAVRRARRALDELPDGPRIDTVRGVGYRLRVST